MINLYSTQKHSVEGIIALVVPVQEKILKTVSSDLVAGLWVILILFFILFYVLSFFFFRENIFCDLRK